MADFSSNDFAPSTPTGGSSSPSFSANDFAPTTSAPTVDQAVANTPVPESNSIESRVANVFPQTIQAAKDIGVDPLNLQAKPQNALSDWWKGITDSVSKAGDDISNAFSKYSNTPTTAGRIGSGLSGLADTVGAVISPITSLFSAANDIPILGTVSKGLNVGFSALGDAGKNLGKEFVSVLPISDQAKQQVGTGIEDIFSLATQMYVGGKIGEQLPGIKDIKQNLIDKYGNKDANTIVDKASEMAQQKIDHSQGIETKPSSQDIAEQVRTAPAPEEKAPITPVEKPVSNVEEEVPTPNENVVTTPALRTFDFHEMEGQPQTDEANAKIHQQIIDNPDKPMVPGGETFDGAADRILSKVKDIVAKEGNVGITTHNSAYGLIKLWDEYGRPDTLSRKFREEYTKQDNTNPTGDTYEIKSPKGDIQLIRHGETTDNAKKVFRTPEAELTDKGRDQAASAGEDLKDKGLTKIYSSDLPRAVETSNIIMDKVKGEEATSPSEKGSVQTTKEGEQVPNKRADTLLKTAVEKKIIEQQGESSTHEKGSTEKWANDAVDYINKNPDTYMDVATGRERPADLSDRQIASIYTAAEIKAIQEGDVEKIDELVKSTVPTAGGQTLKALDSNNPDSPVKAMRDIRKTQEKIAEEQAKKEGTTIEKKKAKEMKKADTIVKESKAKVTKSRVQAFIDSLPDCP